MDIPFKKPTGFHQKRYVLTFFLFLATFCIMCLRVDLSVTMVAMVNQSAILNAAPPMNTSRNATYTATCPMDDMTSQHQPRVQGHFIWDKKTQGMILSSFFYGYLVLQIFGGWLASHFSAKWTVGLALCLDGVLALFIPLAARAGYIWLMVIRIIQGLAQGLLYPAIAALVGKWIPRQELVFLTAVRMTGASLGLVLGQLFAGLLSDGPGWPTVFYIYGSFTVLWFLCWSYFVVEDPGQHSTISQAELEYIESSLGKAKPTRAKNDPTPWLRIMTTPATYACMSIFMAFDWCQFTLLTSLPQYINDILRFSLSANGSLSSLPYVGFTISILLTSKAIDKLSRRVNITLTRKLSITIGACVLSIFLFSLRYIDCNRTLAVAMIVMGYSFQAFTQVVVSVAPLDLTRQYAGIVHGISNTCSGVAGAVAPYVVGVLTQGGATREQWMYVFYITCGISLGANVIFVVFGSSELQGWDAPVDLDLDVKNDVKIGTRHGPEQMYASNDTVRVFVTTV